MKRGAIIVFISLLMIVPTGVQGQIKGLLKKLGNEAAKSAVEEKREEEKEEVNPGRSIMGLFGGGEEVAHRDVYKFDGKIVMLMETYDDNSVDGEIEYTTFINSKNSDVAIEIKPISGEAASGGNAAMNMIYDQENRAILMIYNMDGQKTAIASSIDEDTEIDEEYYDEEIDDTPEYSKTGRTKRIAGYSCEEYTMDDGVNRVNMWVTNDLPFKPANKEIMRAGVPLYNSGPFGDSMVMEMEMFENEIKQVTMTVKEVDASVGKSISMDGYTFMNVGGRN